MSNLDRKDAALADAFVTLRAIRNNALTPTMKSMAEKAAGVCLWALGCTQEAYGIKPQEPDGPIIDLRANVEEFKK